MAKADPDICPICGEEARAVCRCPIGERLCKNKHYWHTCPVHGTVVADIGDHANPQTCTCGKEG